MTGVMLRHRTARSEMVLVPVVSKPFPIETVEPCPGCHIPHLVKTVHLMVNDTGLVMVSTGVLEDLRAAGMPDLDVVGEERNPPPLRVDGGSPLSFADQRAAQDKEHRRIIVRR